MDLENESSQVNPLSSLLSLPKSQKLERGLEHTPREIAQQPETWLSTWKNLKARQKEIAQFLSAAGVQASPERRPIVFLVGAGTSDYIGHSLHHLLQNKWQCVVIPVASTSLLTGFEDYVSPERRYLWISFSRSGDSSEGVAVLQRAVAENPNIRHLLVSCNGSGRMMSAIENRPDSLTIVLDEKTNDRGLAMTGSFTNMLVAGQILAHTWSLSGYEPILDALANTAQSMLPQIAGLASDLADGGYARACFVGSGALAGAAMESALKLLELTAGRLQTMSQSTLALRHGPMAALDSETLFTSFVSSEPRRRRYELDLLRDIGSKNLVRTRVAVATADSALLRRQAEHVLAPGKPVDIPDLYRPALDVIFGQLLGLFASIHFGLKPDIPSPSGAIGRVVENVSIY